MDFHFYTNAELLFASISRLTNPTISENSFLFREKMQVQHRSKPAQIAEAKTTDYLTHLTTIVRIISIH